MASGIAGHKPRAYDVVPSPARVFQDEQPLVLVGDVDIAAAVDEHVLGLRHQPVLQEGAVALPRIGREKIADLARSVGVGDVVDAQSRVEIGEIDQIALRLDIGIVQQRVLIVRAEAAALLAEALVGRARRWQRQRKDRHEPRLRRVGDVDDRGLVERLLTVLADRLRVGDRNLAIGHRDDGVDADEGNERRAVAEMPDLLRMRHVGDVEDIHAGAAIGQECLVADDEGRTVQRGAGRRRRRLAVTLALHPPTADLDRMRRIADVDIDIHVVLEARHVGGEMHVLAAPVPVAMGAGRPGLEVPHLLRVEPVADVPDEHALVVRLAGIAAPLLRHLLQRGDHRVAGEVHLDGPGVGRPRDELDHFRVGGIGHVDDRPAEVPQMAHVQVPAAVLLQDRHLEAGFIAELAIADDLDVLAHATRRDGIGA